VSLAASTLCALDQICLHHSPLSTQPSANNHWHWRWGHISDIERGKREEWFQQPQERERQTRPRLPGGDRSVLPVVWARLRWGGWERPPTARRGFGTPKGGPNGVAPGHGVSGDRCCSLDDDMVQAAAKETFSWGAAGWHIRFGLVFRGRP
jgi:hypothetical protein